jgi:L-lactate dehydrogenase (cytochrome)
VHNVSFPLKPEERQILCAPQAAQAARLVVEGVLLADTWIVSGPFPLLNAAAAARYGTMFGVSSLDMSGGPLSIGRYFMEMLDPSMNGKMWLRWCSSGTANSALKVSCPQKMRSARPRSAVLALLSRTMVADSSTDHGHHSTNWPKSSRSSGWRGATGDPCLESSLGGRQGGRVGRYYLFPLAVAGQAGVERALSLMRTELERDMKLMGCTRIGQLSQRTSSGNN